MTAPDVNADVRARFEAGVSRYMGNGRASLARSEESGIYLVPAVESMWLGYRAAHADMAERAEKAERERDFLVEEYERAVRCGKQGYLHAAMHLFNAITNARIFAHADMVGEVRELVEAASQGVIDGTGRLYFESGHKADNFRRALTALAKFTHQEKP